MFLAIKMNFSTPLYEPTHLIWMIEKSCKCPKADNICIRPVTYGKPVICVNQQYGTNFHHYLETSTSADWNEWMLMAIIGLLMLLLLIQVNFYILL
jgi:hypothetical protein